jgi:hypothetical protein
MAVSVRLFRVRPVMYVLLRWLIPRLRSPTDCVKDKETEKATKVQQKAVEPLSTLRV